MGKPVSSKQFREITDFGVRAATGRLTEEELAKVETIKTANAEARCKEIAYYNSLTEAEREEYDSETRSILRIHQKRKENLGPRVC